MRRQAFEEYLDDICRESETEERIQEAGTIYAWIIWAGIFCFTLMYVVGIV